MNKKNNDDINDLILKLTQENNINKDLENYNHLNIIKSIINNKFYNYSLKLSKIHNFNINFLLNKSIQKINKINLKESDYKNNYLIFIQNRKFNYLIFIEKEFIFAIIDILCGGNGDYNRINDKTYLINREFTTIEKNIIRTFIKLLFKKNTIIKFYNSINNFSKIYTLKYLFKINAKLVIKNIESDFILLFYKNNKIKNKKNKYQKYFSYLKKIKKTNILKKTILNNNLPLLTKIFQNELPQIKIYFLILFKDLAQDFFKSIDLEYQYDLSIRISNLNNINKIYQDAILNSIINDVFFFKKYENIDFNGIKFLANLLLKIDKNSETNLINILKEKNNQIKEKIFDNMFDFEDIVKLQDKDINKILKEIEIYDLEKVLINCSNDIKEKILKNLNFETRNIVENDLIQLQSIKPEEIEEKRKLLLEKIRYLIENNEINIR